MNDDVTSVLMQIRDVLNVDLIPQWEDEYGPVGIEGESGEFYVSGVFISALMASLFDSEDISNSEESDPYVNGMAYVASVVSEAIISSYHKVMPVYADDAEKSNNDD